MKLPDCVIDHIRSEAEKLHHGRIILELNDTSDKIDIVTEGRERFKKDPGDRPEVSEKGVRRAG